MTVWGVAMVKNEIDILEYNIDWLLTQVDNLLISDNLSTDGTFEMLVQKASHHHNIYVVQDNELAYHHGEEMNRLFGVAKEKDPLLEWIVPFDADEFFFSKAGTVKETLEASSCDVVVAPVWHMISSADTEVLHPLTEISWRQENPEKFPVVAFRWNESASIHIGNHGVDWPSPRIEHGIIEVKHYQYRSLPQFIRKVRNGKSVLDMSNFDAGICAHWREYGAMSDQQLAEIFMSWANESGLVFDPW